MSNHQRTTHELTCGPVGDDLCNIPPPANDGKTVSNAATEPVETSASRVGKLLPGVKNVVRNGSVRTSSRASTIECFPTSASDNSSNESMNMLEEEEIVSRSTDLFDITVPATFSDSVELRFRSRATCVDGSSESFENWSIVSDSPEESYSPATISSTQSATFVVNNSKPREAIESRSTDLQMTSVDSSLSECPGLRSTPPPAAAEQLSFEDVCSIEYLLRRSHLYSSYKSSSLPFWSTLLVRSQNEQLVMNWRGESPQIPENSRMYGISAESANQEENLTERLRNVSPTIEDGCLSVSEVFRHQFLIANYTMRTRVLFPITEGAEFETVEIFDINRRWQISRVSRIFPSWTIIEDDVVLPTDTKKVKIRLMQSKALPKHERGALSKDPLFLLEIQEKSTLCLTEETKEFFYIGRDDISSSALMVGVLGCGSDVSRVLNFDDKTFSIETNPTSAAEPGSLDTPRIANVANVELDAAPVIPDVHFDVKQTPRSNEMFKVWYEARLIDVSPTSTHRMMNVPPESLEEGGGMKSSRKYDTIDVDSISRTLDEIELNDIVPNAPVYLTSDAPISNSDFEESDFSVTPTPSDNLRELPPKTALSTVNRASRTDTIITTNERVTRPRYKTITRESGRGEKQSPRLNVSDKVQEIVSEKPKNVEAQTIRASTLSSGGNLSHAHLNRLKASSVFAATKPRSDAEVTRFLNALTPVDSTRQHSSKVFSPRTNVPKSAENTNSVSSVKQGLKTAASQMRSDIRKTQKFFTGEGSKATATRRNTRSPEKLPSRNKLQSSEKIPSGEKVSSRQRPVTDLSMTNTGPVSIKEAAYCMSYRDYPTTSPTCKPKVNKTKTVKTESTIDAKKPANPQHSPIKPNIETNRDTVSHKRRMLTSSAPPRTARIPKDALSFSRPNLTKLESDRSIDSGRGFDFHSSASMNSARKSAASTGKTHSLGVGTPKRSCVVNHSCGVSHTGINSQCCARESSTRENVTPCSSAVLSTDKKGDRPVGRRHNSPGCVQDTICESDIFNSLLALKSALKTKDQQQCFMKKFRARATENINSSLRETSLSMQQLLTLISDLEPSFQKMTFTVRRCVLSKWIGNAQKVTENDIRDALSRLVTM